jgi:riboflavin synthase
VGHVVGIEPNGDSAVLTVDAQRVAEDVTHGASIAVNGVCLTVTGWTERGARRALEFDVMGESLKRTALGALKSGDDVNLERAVRADQRLDGHVVQGHVDGTGVVLSRTPGSNWETVRFALPSELARYVAEKGSVAVDGVSLTVSAVGGDWFEVGLIPETLRATVLGTKQAGGAVNLEVDVLAKYVARLLDVTA